MRIQQSGFHIKTDMGEFIGIVAFDAEKHTAKEVAHIAWGSSAEITELAWNELARAGKTGVAIFTYSHND